MMHIKIVAVALALFQCISAKGIGFNGIGGLSGGNGGAGGYGSGFGSIGDGHGGVGDGFGGWGSGGISQPKPYSTGYQSSDGQGGGSFKTEQGDASGNVKGSYGYTDAQGLYRKVDYTAGAAGFTATVKTNEPGVDGKENPADVIMNVQKTPAGIQEKYTRPAGSRSGQQGGWGAGSSGSGFSGLTGLSGINSGSYGWIGGQGSGFHGGFGGIGSSGFTGIARGGMGVRSGKSGY